jgi:hypothetical protein
LIIREPLSPYLAILKGFRSGQHIDFGPYSTKPSSKIGELENRAESPWRKHMARSGEMRPDHSYLFPKRNNRGGHMGPT